MTYKETLFFIGKSLTVNQESTNKKLVEGLLKDGTVDWDNVVRVSTSHYVFPALYCNLKRANLLHYLPEDLVEYMKHITDLNRERNEQIIEQSKEINNLLLANNITPIFLKGAAFLLQGLYEDIAERMVGDIDFLVADEQIDDAVSLLKEEGYYILKEEIPKSYGRHYPRLVHDSKICAIEAHREVLRKRHQKYFNYKTIHKDIFKTNENTFSMGITHELGYNILVNQVNDYGYMYKNFSLKTIYDTYLLSQKTNTLDCISTFKHHQEIINNNIGISSVILNSEATLHHKKDKALNKHLNLAFSNNKLRTKALKLYLPFYRGLNIVKDLFTKKDYFLFLTTKIFSLKWYKERFFK